MIDITIGNTPLIWRVACAVLAFYCLSTIPIAYIFYTHRRRGLAAWSLLSLYVALQLAGYGIIAGAGEGGAPTYIAYLLTSTGLSLLIMGAASIVHEWFTTTKIANERKNAHDAKALLYAFYLVGLFALAFEAAAGGVAGTQAFGESLYEGAAFFLALLFLVLTTGSLGLWWKYSHANCRPLIWSVLLALPFLGVRYFYQLASAFANTIDLSLLFGKLVYRVCFQILPQAIVLVLLIVGAVMGRHVNDDAKYGAHVELAGEGDDEAHAGKR